MPHNPNVSQYDYDRLPTSPFAIYFMIEGTICPKKMFTVTKKRINPEGFKVEVYVKELRRYIEFLPENLQLVSHFHLN